MADRYEQRWKKEGENVLPGPIGCPNPITDNKMAMRGAGKALYISYSHLTGRSVSEEAQRVDIAV